MAPKNDIWTQEAELKMIEEVKKHPYFVGYYVKAVQKD